MNRPYSGNLPDRGMIAAQREHAPRQGEPPQPVVECLIRWVAWGLLLLGAAAAGLWEHWLR